MTPTRTPTSTDPRFDFYPDLTYRYGFTPDEIFAMPKSLVRVYIDALPRLTALDLQNAILASSFPKMKPADQKRIMRRLERQSQTARREPEPAADAPMNPEAFKLAMAARGIGFKGV